MQRLRHFIILLAFVLNGLHASESVNPLKPEYPQYVQLANSVEQHTNMGVGRLTRGRYGWTALMDAAMSGDIDAVNTLLNEGLDVNVKSDAEDTALTVATYYGHIDVAQLLLEKGADPNLAGRFDTTALIIAAGNGHIEIVKSLLQKGANAAHIPNSKTDSYSALEIASIKGHIEIVKLLIPHSNSKSIMSSALRNAAWKKHNDIVKLLLVSGANPDLTREKNSRLALLIAVESNNYQAVKLLLQYGANVNQTSGRYNVAPLESAVKHGYLDIAESLIQKGAKVAILYSADRTLIDIANSNSDMAMVALLKKYKAPVNSPETEEFIYTGIKVLMEIKDAHNINEHLKNSLGEPDQEIKLEDKKPYHDPTIVHSRVKWIYDGLHFILTAEKHYPTRTNIEYIELTSSKYELIYGLRVGLNMQKFVEELGYPIQLSKGTMMYRIRTVTSHDLFDDTVKLEIDKNSNVRTIIWSRGQFT